MKTKISFSIFLTTLLILSITIAQAASPGITPSTVEALVFPGESINIAKTVTTPEILPKPDIYFLADNTGSMDPALANVKTNAATILATVQSSTNDPRFGAGYYRDFPSDPVAFGNQAPIQAADDGGAAAVAAINAWVAGGGFDHAEGQFFALDQLASGAANWRAGSARIVVWFGDAAGHDPICSAISGLPYDITEASLTAKLVAQKIRVIAIGVINTGSPIVDGLNGDPTTWSSDYAGTCATVNGSAGQAQRLATATNGIYLSNVSPEEVSDAILEGLTALSIEVAMESDCAPPIATTFAPITQTVTSGLDAAFTETVAVAVGAAGGTYNCKDWALIDGTPMTDGAGAIIYEQKTIHVPGIVLEPLTATNELLPDATHTVTATVSAGTYGPVPGVRIQFDIIAGPHLGVTGTGTTDVNGKAAFTYGPGPVVSPANLGTDTIKASFTNPDGSVIYGSAYAEKTWVDTTPPDAACVPGVNPGGKNIPRAPGQGKHGQNQDGFYELFAADIVWPPASLMVWITDAGTGTVFGPFSVGTNIKYTQTPGGDPRQVPMGGEVDWHIFGQGDAVITATDGSGNTSTGTSCLVPPPPM